MTKHKYETSTTHLYRLFLANSLISVTNLSSRFQLVLLRSLFSTKCQLSFINEHRFIEGPINSRCSMTNEVFSQMYNAFLCGVLSFPK